LNWQDFWGQVVGGAIGVLVGYFASETATWWRSREVDDHIRRAIGFELRQNQIEARWIRSMLDKVAIDRSYEGQPPDADSLRTYQGHEFAGLAEPQLSTHMWEVHQERMSDVFSSDDIEILMRYYRAVRDVGAVWHDYQRARLLNFHERAPTSSNIMVMMPPDHFGRSVMNLQPRLDSALRAVQLEGTFKYLGVSAEKWRARFDRSLRSTGLKHAIGRWLGRGR
jgi:hypothetical protein